MSPQNSTGSTQDSDSWVSSQSCDSQVLSDDGGNRNTMCKEYGNQFLNYTISSNFCTGRAQQNKKRKQFAKKLVLDRELTTRVMPVSTKVFKQGRTEPAEETHGKGGLLESCLPGKELQSIAPLEQHVKDDNDWIHAVQVAEKPVEQNMCKEERIDSACWSAVEQSSEEELSRDGSQLISCEEFAAASDAKSEEDDAWDLITCFCLKPFAGRPMIECNECATWIHLSCAKIRKSNVPDIFICQRCRDAKQEIRRSNRARTVPRKRFCD
ncbi:PHD finger protein 13-like isoform X2 [Tiliqua scincoides]